MILQNKTEKGVMKGKSSSKLLLDDDCPFGQMFLCKLEWMMQTLNGVPTTDLAWAKMPSENSNPMCQLITTQHHPVRFPSLFTT